MPNPPPIIFDATRAAVYVELVVTQDAVDTVTGSNPGVVDATTALVFTYNQGGPSGGNPAVANATQIAVLPDGTRVIRVTPGVILPAVPPSQVASGTAPWSIHITASGLPASAGSTTLSGTTPPVVSVQGVAWNGVAESTTQPT